MRHRSPKYYAPQCKKRIYGGLFEPDRSKIHQNKHRAVNTFGIKWLYYNISLAIYQTLHYYECNKFL